MLLQDVMEVRNPLRSQTLIRKAQTLFFKHNRQLTSYSTKID